MALVELEGASSMVREQVRAEVNVHQNTEGSDLLTRNRRR